MKIINYSSFHYKFLTHIHSDIVTCHFIITISYINLNIEIEYKKSSDFSFINLKIRFSAHDNVSSKLNVSFHLLQKYCTPSNSPYYCKRYSAIKLHHILITVIATMFGLWWNFSLCSDATITGSVLLRI